MDTTCPQRGGKPARTSTNQRSPEPSQSSSLVWRPRHPLIVSSKVADIDSYDSLGPNAIAMSYQDVIRFATTEPYLHFGVHGATELSYRSISDEGPSSWIRSAHVGVANSQGEIRRCMVPCHRESLLWDSEHALTRSSARVGDTDIQLRQKTIAHAESTTENDSS